MDNGASSYRRFLEGDESAFDEIMKELFDGLVFFIDRYVHDIHAAEDIAIDAFSDLVVNKHRYNFKVTLKTYLFMLGRSRALNYIKRRKIIDFVELSEAEKVSTELEALEETVLKNERKRIVNNALDSLPDDMRVVIHLIYFEDLSYDEAGKVMKKSRKQELLCKGWFLPPNTYDCGSFVVNGTAVVGKEQNNPYNRWKSTQKGVDSYEIHL